MLVLVVVAATGCVGAATMGDRAMETGDYSLALKYYEEAIADGSKDPDLYYQAAQAAQRQGAFGKAERYFSQSLRYGGGNDVARDLAEFYIQTSNFSKAVRVFQYLIRTEQDLQQLYSNMGTAMMYAGMYIDAESYLLLAQQEDPMDPVPYINLGVLYDRHLRNRPKAIVFYDCFQQLSQDSNRVRTVQTRIREIESRSSVDTSRVGLECGQAYRMMVPEREDLSEVFELGEENEGQFDSGAPIIIERLNRVLTLDPEDARPPQEEPHEDPTGSEGQSSDVIELDDLEADKDYQDGIEVEEPIVEPSKPSDGQRRQEPAGDAVDKTQALEAFDAGRYDEVVEALEARTEQRLSIEEQRMLGRSYYRVGRFDDAAEILAAVIEQEPTPQSAELLIESYRRSGNEGQKQRICDRFSGWPDYEEALQGCN